MPPTAQLSHGTRRAFRTAATPPPLGTRWRPQLSVYLGCPAGTRQCPASPVLCCSIHCSRHIAAGSTLQPCTLHNRPDPAAVRCRDKGLDAVASAELTQRRWPLSSSAHVDCRIPIMPPHIPSSAQRCSAMPGTPGPAGAPAAAGTAGADCIKSPTPCVHCVLPPSHSRSCLLLQAELQALRSQRKNSLVS